MMLDRLSFDQKRHQNPELYEKADLAATSIKTRKRGEYVVQRGESDTAHPCSLVIAADEAYGHCSCDGFGYNSGPCSHLCAVWRAHHAGILQLPTGRIQTVTVELTDRDEERADQQEQLDQPVAPDGGGRHGREL